MIQHASKIIHHANRTVYTTVCGRMNAKSQDGMNIAEKKSDVTCKFCLKRLAALAALGATP
jgi:hypothetical protein